MNSRRRIAPLPPAREGFFRRLIRSPRRRFTSNLRPRRLQPHVNILLLRIGEHLLKTFLAADARLFEAAERRAEKMFRDLVDPDETGIHLAEHLGFVAPFADCEDRPENFLAGNTHRRLHVGEYRRLDEEAFGEGSVARPAAAGEKPRASLLGAVDEAANAR